MTARLGHPGCPGRPWRRPCGDPFYSPQLPVPAQNKGRMDPGSVATHFPDAFNSPPSPPSLPLTLTTEWWETLECTEMSEGTRDGRTRHLGCPGSARATSAWRPRGGPFYSPQLPVPAQKTNGRMVPGGVDTHFPDAFSPLPPPSLPPTLTMEWEGTRGVKTQTILPVQDPRE